MAEGSGSSGLQDDELYLPRTVVNKLIKEIVPNIRVTNDARDLLLNCCTEFIHLIASEASDISENQQKKVISPEHVVEALNTLGFQEYVADVEAVHKEYKEQASKHRKRGKSKLDRLGIPEEELLRQQQQLFEEARQQQMESDLLEHQRAQQQLQQQQQQQLQQQLQQQPQPTQQSIQQPPPPQQQTSLPPNSLQQQQLPHTLPQPQSQSQAQPQAPAPANQPNLAAVVGAQQFQQLQGLTLPPAAASPSQVPAVVSSQTASLATANAGGASTLVGPGRSVPPQGGVSLPPTSAPVLARSSVSSQPIGVHGGELQKTTVGAAAVQPRPILPAPPTAAAQGTGTTGTGGINMAGLNMLAAVGARQQQQLQQQQQQATASPQPPQAKGPPPILPNNAAITVASLQATSSLLQQALAMASAQVAANNTAQQQQQQRPPATSGAPSSVLGGATGAGLPLPQSLLLQQQALAALAAQQVQMGSQLGQQLAGQTAATKAAPFPASSSSAGVPGIPGTGAGIQLPMATTAGNLTGSGMESGLSHQLDSKVFPPT